MVRAVTPIPFVKARFFDRCGKPLAGGKVHTYEANTTTPKVTYKDPYGLTPNTNPIILDAAGEADIYLEGTYRIRITDRNDVLVNDVAKIGSWFSDNLQDTLDNISGAMDDALKPVLQNLDDVINTAAAAGAGAKGWTDQLIALPNGRSQRQKNSDIVSVKDFGAKGDGITDDLQAFKDAIQRANTNKQSLYIPYGTYKVSALLDVTCSVFGDGTILGELRVKANDIVISGITVDGQNKNTPINLMGVKNVVVKNITAHNANFGGIRLDACTDCKLTENHIYNIRNVFGDGICLNRSKNISVINNTIHDITRIGIVADTDVTGEYCENITVAYNTVYHAYGASGGELNGGVWFENTYGGVVHGNTIKDTNSVGNNKGRGIVVTALIKDGKDYPYFITDNTLIDTGWAIATGGSEKNGAKLFIDNNSVHGDYSIGVYLANGVAAKVSNCYFDKGTATLLRVGSYSDTSDISVVFENCSYGNDVTFVPSINLITTEGDKKCNLTISNLIGKWSMSQRPETLNGKLEINNSDIVLLQGTPEQPSYIANFSSYQFNDVNFLIKSSEVRLQGVGTNNNCSFIKDASVINGTNLLCSYTANDLTFSNAKFKGVDVLISLSANIEVLFKECLFSEYTKNAIRSYYSSSSYKLSVINSKFTDTEKTIPIGYEEGTAPNVTVNNVLHNASKVSSTPANVFNTYNMDVPSQVIVEYDPPSLAIGSQQSTTVTYTGLNISDNVNVSFNAPLQGTRMWGEVTAANTVTVYHRNDTGSKVDLPYGLLTVKIV